MPTLRILHKCKFAHLNEDPYMMPHMRCDKGAIRHIFSGSDVMCPGLTSEKAEMDDVPANFPVAVMAEGKDHAMAIGVTKMST